jgi:VIT1/CCC1 family predicted Fe2+/Mn2+ transporter
MAEAVRDLAKAREAYLKEDVEMSRLAHSNVAGPSSRAKEAHTGKPGEYVQAVVFGGLDGIVTTFAVIAAGAALKFTYAAILIITFANLLADAFGMAVGDYLSSVADDDRMASERKRERWEMENVPLREKQEMIDVYVEKGITLDDAHEIVELLWPHQDAFLDIMMVEELNIMPAEQSISPLISGIVTFISFFLLGGAPLVPYLFTFHNYNATSGIDDIFWAGVCVFIVVLWCLGAFKAYITGRAWWLGGFVMVVTGALTAGVAVVAATFLDKATEGIGLTATPTPTPFNTTR